MIGKGLKRTHTFLARWAILASLGFDIFSIAQCIAKI
jgi:hypothetical protein